MCLCTQASRPDMSLCPHLAALTWGCFLSGRVWLAGSQPGVGTARQGLALAPWSLLWALRLSKPKEAQPGTRGGSPALSPLPAAVQAGDGGLAASARGASPRLPLGSGPPGCSGACHMPIDSTLASYKWASWHPSPTPGGAVGVREPSKKRGALGAETSQRGRRKGLVGKRGATEVCLPSPGARLEPPRVQGCVRGGRELLGEGPRAIAPAAVSSRGRPGVPPAPHLPV